MFHLLESRGSRSQFCFGATHKKASRLGAWLGNYACGVRLSFSSPEEVTNLKAFSLPLSSSPPFNETSFVPSASEFVTLLALECIVVYHKLRNLPHSTRNSQIAPSSVRLRSVTLLKGARCGSYSRRPFQSPKLASHSVF